MKSNLKIDGKIIKQTHHKRDEEAWMQYGNRLRYNKPEIK
jgi:hypothetical protein